MTIVRPADPCKRPAERGCRRRRAARCTDGLGDAGKCSLDHRARRLGGAVLGMHPGAAGRDDQYRLAGESIRERLIDIRVSDNDGLVWLIPVVAKPACDCRTGEILARTGRGAR